MNWNLIAEEFFLHLFLMHTAWRVVHINELQLRVFNEVH